MREFIIWTVLYYLRFWAKVALFIHRPYTIGVAGSVGKSSTRNALHAVLKDYKKTYMVYGNSETGIPLGLLGIAVRGFTKKNWLYVLLRAPFGIFNLVSYKYLIVEMGIDDPYPPKNMTYLLTIVKPDMSIDLNVTATHTQQFEKLLKKNTKDTREYLLNKIAEEDSKIITNGYTKVGIFNGDDSLLSRAIEGNSKGKDVKLVKFGEDENFDAVFDEYIITRGKTRFSYRLKSSKGEISIELSFPGLILPPASRESFAAVILAAKALGMTNLQIKESLGENFSLPKGRSSLFEGIRDSMIIDSSYNSSKSTVLSFLDMLKQLKKRTGRPIVFVMGDMRELGVSAKEEHLEVAKALIGVVNELYCVGPLTQEFVVPYVREHKKGSRLHKVVWYKNAVQAGLHLKESLPNDSIVLFKGSQNTIFLEEAIRFVLVNPLDVKKLTRQEEYWQKTKQKFFSIE